MSEIRMTLPELNDELKNIEAQIDALADKVEAEGITEEVVDDETVVVEEERASELIERKKDIEAQINELEKREKTIAELKANKGEVIEEHEERVEKMTNNEIRNSAEYIEAFARYTKTGKDEECRALLSDNTVGGTVPVPAFVADIVAKALEESEILSRVRRMNAGGNVKVGFEIDAPAAEAHTEGGDAIDPEALSLGIVTLIATTYKKYVQISDEALDTMNGEAYLNYIYDEVARGIIKAREDAVVNAILNAPQTATATAPAVAATGTTTPDITDFVNARALLSSAARDLVIICSPQDYATYKGLQMGANYGVDPFDGLTVLFSDAATAPIIGDLSGVMENLPKGDDVEFKYDDKTLMTSDIVNVLGRMPAAIGVVGNKYFAKVAEGDSE